MDADGSNLTQLTFTLGTNETEPAVSPDGTKIAFTVNSTSIWVMGIDGSDPMPLTDQGSNVSPTWSPDGTRIAFESNRTGVTFTIWVMNADGSNQHLVINREPSSNVEDPAWSPDGTMIAYVRSNPCPSIAAASAADGSGEIELVGCGTSAFVRYPAWSPDGSHIAYQRLAPFTTGFWDIYTLDIATNTQTNLTANGDAAHEYYPAWSPDGTQISYAVLSGQWHIWRIDADGTGNVSLASGEQPDWGPAAAPPPDTTQPSVICGSTDGLWHASDVSIPCTASDSGSGLADPADVSFSLVTNVSANTENANAATNSREVCDKAGNCSTVGPFGGQKVDKKASAISIAAPANTATYLLNAAIAASYGCSDGGSGVASCSGPVANGSSIDTSSVGSKSFTVAATDTVGNGASQTVTYIVKMETDTTPPALTLPTVPVEMAQSAAGAPVTFVVSAIDLVSGSITPVCNRTSGSTFSIGTTTVTCTAIDQVGNVATGSFQVGVACCEIGASVSAAAVKRGQTVSIAGFVRNFSAVSQPITLTFELTTPYKEKMGSVPLTLAAGTNKTFSVPFKIPANATLGSYSVTLKTATTVGVVERTIMFTVIR